MDFLDWDGFLFRFGFRGAVLVAVDAALRIILSILIVYFFLIRSKTLRPADNFKDIVTNMRILMVLMILAYIFQDEMMYVLNYLKYFFL